MSVCCNRQSGHYNFRTTIPAHAIYGKSIGPSLGKGGTCLAHARLVPGGKGTRKVRVIHFGMTPPPRPGQDSPKAPAGAPCRAHRNRVVTPVAPLSGADRSLQRLAGGCDFTAIIMSAMAADMMRALEFATVGAFGMCRNAQRGVAATHATTGRRGFSLGYSHGPGPLRSGSQPAGTPSWRYTGQLSIIEGGALADHLHLRKCAMHRVHGWHPPPLRPSLRQFCFFFNSARAEKGCLRVLSSGSASSGAVNSSGIRLPGLCG